MPPESVPTRPHSCIVCGASRHTCIATGTDYQYQTTKQHFDWCQCDSCGHLYINPLPTEEALSLIYPDSLKNYEDFDARPGLAFRVKAILDGWRFRKLTKDIPAGGRLLDVGCAAGTLLDTIKRYCPNIEILEGLDISERAAAHAKRKGYKVYVSTIETAQLPTDFYDVIVLQQVIEHVHDPRAVLKRLHCALRTGGRLILETPNLFSWDHFLFRKGYWEGYHIPRHFNLWSTDGMRTLLNQTGFSMVTYRKRIKPVHWTLSLQNWAIATEKPNSVIRFFDLKNPLLLAVFGIVDLIQLMLQGKASDIQYSAVK